jgi:hypothetical protein
MRVRTLFALALNATKLPDVSLIPHARRDRVIG